MFLLKPGTLAPCRSGMATLAVWCPRSTVCVCACVCVSVCVFTAHSLSGGRGVRGSTRRYSEDGEGRERGGSCDTAVPMKAATYPLALIIVAWV